MAGDIVIVSLCIVEGCDGQVHGWPRNRPAGLGDPHRFALAGGNSQVVVVPEGGVGVFDRVGFLQSKMKSVSEGTDLDKAGPRQERSATHGGFIVGIGIDTEKVGSGNQGVLARVGPDIVCVDVADGLVGGTGSGDGAANLADIVDNDVRTNTHPGVAGDANGSDTINVLGADADAGNEVGESGAVLGNGSIQSSKLVLEDGLAGRSPQAEEQSGTGADGGRDGRDGCICRAILDHGIQSRRGVA